MNEQHQHLDLEKVSKREMDEWLKIARLQGQWTTTKSFMHQAELLGETDTKVYQQMKVHLDSVEKRLPTPNQLNNGGGSDEDKV